MKVQILGISLFAMFTSSCATNGDSGVLSGAQREAVCSAQSFLMLNGYLDGAAYSDRSKITLELWDKMTFSKNGVLDWNALLLARSKTFDKRLYGVQAVDGGHLISYKMDKGFRCIFVGATDVRLNEAACHPGGASLMRVVPTSLACRTTGDKLQGK